MGSNKMNIVAYKTNQYQGKGIGGVGIKINPASYTHKHQVNYGKKIGCGRSNTTLKFANMPPETVSFEIYFDGTGAIKNIKEDVETQIKKFKDTCWKFNGKIHEPNFLIITWGSLIFKCKLTALSLNYTLFKSDGTPLRAKASVSFEEALDQNLITKTAKTNSPDLTHYILVKEGDNLPLLCDEIYGDCSYYMEVARHNKLVNFRELIPGTKLYMPPIK